MKTCKPSSTVNRMAELPSMKGFLFCLVIICLSTFSEKGFGQTWNAFNDFWYTEGQGWTGSTTPNAWGYFAGNTAGGGTSQIGGYLAPSLLLSLTSGGSAGAGNGTGDGNVTFYTDYNGISITSLGRYTNGVMYITGAKAAALTTNVYGIPATNGIVDGGAFFDGITPGINVGSAASVNPIAFTYSAWVKPSSFSAAYASIISKAENGRVGTLLLKSDGKLACYIGATGGVVDYDGSGINTLSTNQWYYLTLAYDSVSGLNGYVNGTLDGSAAANGDVITGVDQISIGSHPTFPNRIFNGALDEARISTVARDANWVWAEWQNIASNNVFNSYGAATANSSGNFAAWAHKSQITFSGYTQPETLTDFPVLVNIGANMSGFAWSQFASTNGCELRFADANGNELSYEFDRGAGGGWTNAAGVGQVWVKVPQLSSSTVITAYWGNASATSSAQAYTTNGDVWANGFGGVWHLPDGKILTANDSTSNANNGTGVQANVTAPAGKIGGAAFLNGTTAYINLGNSATVNPAALTYSAWVSPSALSVGYASIISKAENGRVATLLLKNNGKLACYLGTSGGTVDYDGTGTQTLTAGQWYYVTLSYDSVNGLNGYVNGVLDGSAPANGPINTAADAIWIGGHPSIGGRYFTGVIDEARVSTVARDANWAYAEWLNMASNSVFESYGTVAANSSGNFAAWVYQSQISFSGYTEPETLTNFPVLVNIGTNISGFAWSQFANTNGLELRFADANGNELPYETDIGTNASWINNGIGQVWVRVPSLSSATTITAYWGNAAAANTLPSYRTDGSVWANGYGGVYHLSTPGQILSAADSTANQNNGQAAETPGGIGYANTQYLWAEAANFEIVDGAFTPSVDEGFSSVLTWTAPTAGNFQFSGSFLPGSSGVAGQTNVDVAIANSQGGTNLAWTVLTQGGPALPYSFSLVMNEGDSVQFQVGDDFETPAPVGIAATVTQLPTPPTIISATRSLTDPTQVVVQFSETLNSTSATNLANYSITGVNVSEAQLSQSNSSVVILKVSPGLNYPATLTVNGVEGSFGQLPIAPNSTASINLRFYVPNGFGVPTNADVVSFSGSTLDPKWQAALVNHDNTQSNYYFTQVFVQSNGVLHAHANNVNLDMNFLVYVDPNYNGTTEETLMHMTVKNSNFSGSGIAGAAVGVEPDAYDSTPPGGNDIRAVQADYGGVSPDFPTFVACSDFVADEFPTNNYQPWQVGGSYWLRIRQDVDSNAPGTGAIVSEKAWAGDGSVPEPANWQLVYKDPAGLDRVGYGAIRAGYGAGVVMDFDVDYFQVTAAGLTTVTPKLPASLTPLIDVNVLVSGPNAIVTWPAAAPGNYQLQSATSLTGPWANVNAAVTLNGGTNTITVPLNGPRVFFRLIQ